MQRHMTHPGHGVPDSGLFVLVFGGDKRPVVEQRAAQNVCPWNKTPVARVEAVMPVVAHHEELAGRNDQIAILEWLGKSTDQASVAAGCVRAARRENRRGIRVIVRGGGLGEGLVLRNAVDVDDPVVEMDVIAGDADEPLHQVQVRLSGSP